MIAIVVAAILIVVFIVAIRAAVRVQSRTDRVRGTWLIVALIALASSLTALASIPGWTRQLGVEFVWLVALILSVVVTIVTYGFTKNSQRSF